MAIGTEPKKISRRGFLKKTGWVAAGVTVAVFASYPVARAKIPALPTFDGPGAKDGLAWIQALPDGRIRFFCPRMEMGQGAGLGLSQVVAEELNIAQSDVECLLPNTDQTPPFQMTVGSESTANFFDPVSFAAAQLREALRVLAAEKTGVTGDQILDGQGGFILPDGSALGYRDLVSDKAIVLTDDQLLSDDVLVRHAIRRAGQYRAIGQRWPHHETKAIVTGQMTYARDVMIPDMAYGAVIYPPAFGAELQIADGRAAKAMPGVVAVVTDTGENFVGVVADNPFVLESALEAIKVTWQMPEPLNQDQIDARLDVERLRREDDFSHTLLASGDHAAAKQGAKHRATARYDTPFAVHAAMEPRSGLVWVREDRVEVWCGTQDPFFVQKRVAKIVGRAAVDVVVYPHRMGGGFGGRIACQASEAAARLSLAVGRAVRVQWSRETEFRENYFQPAYSHFIDAGVTADGMISHWDHDIVSSSIFTGAVPQFIGRAIDMMGPDEGTIRGAVPQYDVADRRIRYSGLRTPVPIGAWRGLGAAPNTFAIESMIDTLAHSAGIDPLTFRLQNLPPDSARLAGVLRRVADISGWSEAGSTTDQAPDVGRGLACAVYKDKTAVAIVAEVQIDHDARRLQVSRVWCAQDCGLVLNPLQVESQIMGNIIWGCSMALKERVTIDAGRVNEGNFHIYEPLRHHEAPEVITALVIPPDTSPSEVGEAALAPVPAAIANAVFAATGKRIRRLPLSYESIFEPDRN